MSRRLRHRCGDHRRRHRRRFGGAGPAPHGLLGRAARQATSAARRPAASTTAACGARAGRPSSCRCRSGRMRIWAALQELIGIDGEYVRSGHLKIARSEADLASLEAYREHARGSRARPGAHRRAPLRERFPWLGGDVVGRLALPRRRPRQPAPGLAGLRPRRAARRRGRARAHAASTRSRTTARRLSSVGGSDTALEVRAPCCSTAPAPGPAPSRTRSASRCRSMRSIPR